MQAFITLVVCVIFFGGLSLFLKADLENKVDNYPIDKIDNSKLAKDSDKSYTYKKQKLVRGEYDKDEK